MWLKSKVFIENKYSLSADKVEKKSQFKVRNSAKNETEGYSFRQLLLAFRFKWFESGFRFGLRNYYI